MKKIFKKSLAIMVSAAICLTALIGCLSVSAANGEAPVYTVATVEGKKGETVGVNVTGADLTKICGQSVDIKFAAGLEIVKVYDNDEKRDLVLVNNETGGEYNILSNDDGTKTVRLVDIINFPEYGDTPALVTASFDVTISVTIPADASAGTEYPISIDESQFADYDEAWVYPILNSGKITVVEDATGPVEIQEVLVAHSILLTESVGSQIAVNVGSINTLGYSDYYLSIDYKSYASGYILEDKTLTLNSNEYDRQNTSKTVSYFYFTKIALYEMPLEYTVTVFLKNNENEVVAYSKSTSSIQSQALAYAQKYSTDIKLLTTLVDMVNYGAAAQTFFAQLNPGSDIVDALLPTNGFEAYQQYASSTDDLPESFNTIKEIIKDVPETTLVPTATILIGASNSIQYKFMANNYDSSKLSLEVSYLDSYGTLQEATVPFTDLAVQQSGDNTIYTYVYSDLAIYDLEKTVTVKIVNNGITELTYKYSVGNFVNANIGNTSFADILTKMELFSQSARIKLVGE